MCEEYLLAVERQPILTFFQEGGRRGVDSYSRCRTSPQIGEGTDIIGFMFKISSLASFKSDEIETLKKNLSSNLFSR